MVKVDLIGFDSFSERIKNASKEVQAEVASEVAAAAADFEAGAIRNLISNGSSNNSTLASSIDKKQVTSFEWDVFAGAFYAPFIEFGTKGKYRPIPGTEDVAAQFKGYSKGNFAQMLAAITKWVKRKGIGVTYSVKTKRKNRQTKDNINQIAFAITMSILKNGISPKPFFYSNIPTVKANLTKRLEAALNNAL